jgi:hypothetical protein
MKASPVPDHHYMNIGVYFCATMNYIDQNPNSALTNHATYNTLKKAQRAKEKGA